MKPSWVENARLRGEQDDDIAYWCRLTVSAIELKRVLFQELTNGCSVSTGLRDFEFPFTISDDFDTWPVEVIRDG